MSKKVVPGETLNLRDEDEDYDLSGDSNLNPPKPGRNES